MASHTRSVSRIIRKRIRYFSSGRNGPANFPKLLHTAGQFRVEGLVVAPLTPFTSNGELLCKDLGRCVDFFQRTHIKNIFVNGTLGEGKSLTTSERKQSAERWMEETRGKMPVILHIGAETLPDTRELAKHAEEIGVAAIAALPPTYHKPATEEALIGYMARVAEAAPSTPFLLYEYNVATGIFLDIPRFLRLAESRIPTLCGLKHTSPELTSALDCSLVAGGRYQVLFGTLEMYLPALSLGLDPVITVPYLGPIFHHIKSAFDAGDMAAALRHQILAQALSNIVKQAGGGCGAIKALFELLSGIPVGPPRPPLQSPSPIQRQEMESALGKQGFI